VSSSAPVAEFTDVCALDDLREDEIHLVQLERRPPLGLTVTAGKPRAFSVMCPHRGGPLELGEVRALVVSDGPGDRKLDQSRQVLACPWHNWEYSLDDGCAVADSRRKIRIYDLEVVDGRVRVRLDS
jgi:nitrite reductase (NADH) small subunit